MNKIKFLLIILIILAMGVLIILSFNGSLTGNVIDDRLNTFSYTKAICNETNFCQDNEITCKGNKTVSVIPLTGAVIQHSKNWQDPRNQEEREKLC